MGIKHAKVSAKSDGGDATLVLPSDWNDEHVITGLSPAFIGAANDKSTTQALTTATWTAVTFPGADRFDTDAFHDPSTNSDRWTIPAGLGGKYLLIARIQFAANATGDRYVRWTKNGTQTQGNIPGGASTAGAAHTLGHSTVIDLAAGDYVGIDAYQDSGGDLNITGTFDLVKLDSGKVGQGIGARVHRTTNQTPITTQTAILFDAEDFDTDGFHSTSSDTDRLTIPAGLGGKYLVIAHTFVSAIEANTNYVHGRITKNGLAGANIVTTRQPRSPDNNTLIVLSGVADLVAGDYVQSTIESDDASFEVTTSGTGGGGGVPSFSIMRLDSGSNSLGEWTNYTPTWSSDGTPPTIGNGSITGRYRLLASGLMALSIRVACGSTTTAGTGNYNLQLPPGFTGIDIEQTVAAHLLEGGVSHWAATASMSASGTSFIVWVNSSAPRIWTASSPFVPGDTDTINVSGVIGVIKT